MRMSRTKIGSKLFALIVAFAFLAAACTQEEAAEDGLQPINLGVGSHTGTSFQEAFRYYDEQNDLINEVGREYGYDIDVTWFEFPFAAPHLAAFEAGDVQIGAFAFTPLAGQLAAGRPYRVLTNSVGMFPAIIYVREGGPITTPEDLRGKTVGTAIGSSLQSVFETFILVELGETLEEAGIKLVNHTTPTPKVPRGMDAYVSFIPFILPALDHPQRDIEALVQLTPPVETGPAYDGPLGEGAGIPLPSAEDSPWAPEGFIALRNSFQTTQPFVEEHPDVVEAFVVAHQRAMRMFLDWELDEVTEVFPDRIWETMSREAYQERMMAGDLVYKHRKGWVWPTEAMIKILIGKSELMTQQGVLDKPLTLDQVRPAFESVLPILEEAYEKTGSYPDEDVFTARDTLDLRGPPMWEVNWEDWEGFSLMEGLER